jgi:hypothetical protein
VLTDHPGLRFYPPFRRVTLLGAAPHDLTRDIQPAVDVVAVRLGLRTQRLLGPVVAGGPKRRTDPLTTSDPLDRQPNVDGQANPVADRHLQGLDAARRVDRHGIDSASHIRRLQRGTRLPRMPAGQLRDISWSFAGRMRDDWRVRRRSRLDAAGLERPLHPGLDAGSRRLYLPIRRSLEPSGSGDLHRFGLGPALPGGVGLPTSEAIVLHLGGGTAK